MDVLKELNVYDLKDFLEHNDNHIGSNKEDEDQFMKDARPPPPSQHHLKSSRGKVKDRVTAYKLQTHFAGKKLKDFSLLSQLGTGISVIAPDNDIPTVSELVNRKRGKHCRKGKRGTAPLEVIGMDIGYGGSVAVSGVKYDLVLVDQCTTERFVYPMQGSSGGNVAKLFGNSLLMPVFFLGSFNAILIHALSVVGLLLSFNLMAPVSVLLLLIDRIITVSWNGNGNC